MQQVVLKGSPHCRLLDQGGTFQVDFAVLALPVPLPAQRCPAAARSCTHAMVCNFPADVLVPVRRSPIQASACSTMLISGSEVKFDELDAQCAH